MTASGHAIIGTVIASQIGDPVLAVPIAIASHFAADLFPHWDTATHWRTKGKERLFADTFVDLAIAFFSIAILTVYVFPQTNIYYAFFIVFFALLPDIGTAPYLFFGWKIPPFTWFYRLQKVFDNRMDKPWGIIGQVAILILIVAFFKFV